MSASTGKIINFNASRTIDSANTLASLLTFSSQTGNEGTIYFTTGNEARIVLNGKDYTGYIKPTNGIPASDLSQEVQNLITNGGLIIKFTAKPSTPTSSDMSVLYIEQDSKGGYTAYATKQDGGTYSYVPLQAKLISGATLSGCVLDSTPSTSDKSKSIASTEFVQNAIDEKFRSNDAMLFKGVVNSDTQFKESTSGAAAQAGWTFKVGTAGTYAGGHKCEVGDMIIATKDGASNTTQADWSVIQNNIDGAVTNDNAASGGTLAWFSQNNTNVITSSGIGVGNSNKGIYIDGTGQPKEMTCSVDTSVPAGAVFTDAKVTSAANHYDVTNSSLNGSTTDKTVGDGALMTGVQVDSKGHVTAVISGGSISQFQTVANKTDTYNSSSQTTYPTSKALSDGLATKQDKIIQGENDSILVVAESSNGATSGSIVATKVKIGTNLRTGNATGAIIATPLPGGSGAILEVSNYNLSALADVATLKAALTWK